MPTPKNPLHLLALALACAGCSRHASAANRTWIGGDGSWSDGGSALNWSPADEPDADDAAIFNTNNDIHLSSDMNSVTSRIMGLTLSGQANLDLNTYSLTVEGGFTSIGQNSSLIVPTGSLFSTDSINVNGSIQLEGGAVAFSDAAAVAVLTLDETAQVGSAQIIGYGLVTNTDSLSSITNVIVNDGRIIATYIGPIFGGAPATLTLDASDPNGRIDLDGAVGNGIVTVGGMQTLNINLPLSDSFDGDINLSGNATLNLASAWTLSSGTIDVDNGSGLFNAAGTAVIKGGALSQTAGTITILAYDGTLRLDAPFTMTGGNIVNNGIILFNANATISGAATTFTMPTTGSSITVASGITVSISLANFNADGADAATNVLTINNAASLNLSLGQFSDQTLNGTINLNAGSLSVTTNDATWSIAGALNANSGSSTLSGDLLTLSSPTLSVVSGATLTISAHTLFAGGTYGGSGLLRMTGNTTISANTTMSVGTFDWDGTAAGSPHHINDGVTFTINSVNFDTDGDMDDPLSIGGNGAQLIVNGVAQWTMNAVLTANTASAGTATIGGTSRVILASTLNVDGPATISAPVTFDAGSTTSIDAAIALTVNGAATYNGGLISGAGTFHPSTANTVTASTTISVNTINFDRGSWAINAGTLTINSAFIDDSPDGFDAAITIADTAALSINTSSGSWTVDPSATISYSGDPSTNTFLTGSDLHLNGTLNNTGDGRSSARLLIGATGILNALTANEPFRLGYTASPNTLSGGTINGPGLLGADPNVTLSGFGTINAPIDFDANAILYASGGSLTLNGAILDAGILGTADATGILNIPNPWNSSTVDNVFLQGGELKGGVITVNNISGIFGNGLVSARVINNTTLASTAAGNTLLFQTPANDNDWDGTTNLGSLQASAGTLELRDNAPFPFSGSVLTSNATVFANGFELDLQPASSLTLTAGIFKSTHATHLRGTVIVNAGANSEIQGSSTLDFTPTSITTLTGNLGLTSADIIVRAGATFSGPGTFIILPPSNFFPDSGANLNVALQNQGVIAPASTAIGLLNAKSLSQSGILRLQLAGTSPAQFDRLALSANAQLGGTLELSLSAGFFPNLNDTFTILSAASISGSFTTLNAPSSINLLASPVINLNANFTPAYNPTSVILTASNIFYEIQAGTYPQNFSGSGWAVLKTTTGTATLTGPTSSYTGTTTIQAGLLIFNPAQNQTSSLILNPASTARLSGTTPFNKPVTITGSTGNWTSRLDLDQSALILSTSSPADKSAKIALAANQILFAKNAAGPGTWQGNGITSLSVSLNPLTTTIALVDNADLNLSAFNGIPVNADSLIITRALLGDADLNNIVDALDFDAWFKHVGSINNFRTSQADFDLSGTIDALDFDTWFTHVGLTGLPLSPAPSPLPPPSPIPEPTSLLLLAPLLLRRRFAPA